MLDSMRKPFFIVSLIAIFLAVGVEMGSIWFFGSHNSAPPFGVSPAGKAIPAMAFLDGLLFYATLLIGIALLIPERVQAKIQGVITLVFSIILVLGCIVVVFVDLALLILMVSLLMALPFGTMVYLAVWGTFDSDGARVALSLLMTLKLVFAVCLVLAHQRFLQNKGLVLIIITSFVANLLTAFLHGMVPGILVSITDDIAAIIVCVLAIIWAVVYLIGSVVSVIKVII